MGARHRAAALALGLLLAACATPMSESALRGRLRQAASSVHGGRQAVVVPIHADSRMAAWTLRAELRSGESKLPAQLGNRLAQAARRRSVVVVGSAYDGLAREVLLAALASSPQPSLAGLTLVYVGSAETAAAVRPAARARRVRFLHRDLP